MNGNRWVEITVKVWEVTGSAQTDHLIGEASTALLFESGKQTDDVRVGAVGGSASKLYLKAEGIRLKTRAEEGGR